jgi:hypothetical protein
MFGIIALILSVILTVVAYRGARDFTARRLRYTRVAERPGMSGILAGIAAGVLSAPVLGILPLVGVGTAMLVGAGVGTGVVVGARAPLPDATY